MNRSATASQSLGNPERKNTPCISDLAGVKFLLKKERVFFFRGSALQVFGQCVGLQCGRSFGKTIFWGKDLPKLRLICFWIRMSQMEKEGFGEEFSICSAVFFSGISGGLKLIETQFFGNIQLFENAFKYFLITFSILLESF